MTQTQMNLCLQLVATEFAVYFPSIRHITTILKNYLNKTRKLRKRRKLLQDERCYHVIIHLHASKDILEIRIEGQSDKLFFE